MPAGERLQLSVVVAMRDEALGLDALLARVEQSLSTLGRTYEVIAVDDGSLDDTWLRLAKRAESSPWLRCIRLARPFGQHPATIAGLEAAHGDIVATMDADLEVFPEDLRLLVTRLEEGYNIAFGARTHSGAGFLREKAGKAVSRLLTRFALGRPPAGVSTFLAVRRDVVASALRFRLSRPVTPFHLMLAGPKSCSVPVREALRTAGSSKYSLAELLRLTADIFFGYTTLVEPALAVVAALLPLGTVSLWGAAAAFAAVGLGGMFLVFMVAGMIYALTVAALLFSFIGALVVRRTADGSPLYLISETR